MHAGMNPPPQAQPEEEDNGFFSTMRKFGKSLYDYVENREQPEQKLQQNVSPAEMAEEIPQETIPEEASPGILASLKNLLKPRADLPSFGVGQAVQDYFSPTKNREMTQSNKDIVQRAQLKTQGIDPDERKVQIEEERKEKERKALERPWEYAVYGSAEEVANHPVLRADFKKITGIDNKPQIAQQVSQYEEAMEGIEDSLNGINTQLSDQARQIQERIMNNQTTDADKYMIGLALLMPLIIGGVFGKEAGLGALSGGAKGIADVLGNRQKGIREDEAALMDISKQQATNQEKLANIGLEKSKFGPNLRKSLPENPEAHLEGLREIDWIDPETNQKPVEIKPGFNTQRQFVASKEGKADMLKAANELIPVKNYVKEIDDLTEDVIEIVSQLKTEGEKNDFAKGFIALVEGAVPGSLNNLTQDIMLNGKKVNAGIALREKLGLLTNSYGHAKDLGQADRAMQSHVKTIFDNPAATLLSADASINQMLDVRKLAQQGLVESAKNAGFYPQFIIRDLEERNNPVFGALNKTEQNKRLEHRKKQAMQSEENYAQ
jgi:hypothetical protein